MFAAKQSDMKFLCTVIVSLLTITQARSQEVFAFANQHSRTKTILSMEEEYADNRVYVALTKEKYSTFSEADKNKISEVKDGDPLWLHVRFPGPISHYVAVARTNNPDGSVTKRALMRLAVGPQNSEQEYQTTLLCFSGCKPDELVYSLMDESVLNASEFSICLTGFVKNSTTRIFLETVGSGSPGIWDNEIRLMVGEPNKGAPSFIDWLDAVAVAPIRCNVEDGVVKYKQMWAALKDRLEKGDASDNTLPAKGKFADSNIKNLVLSQAKKQGWTVKQCYFENNNWTEVGETTDLDRFRRVHAIVTYKKGTDCFYSIVEVKENYSFSKAAYGPPALEIIVTDTPIECSKY